jgi:hypothetical protein
MGKEIDANWVFIAPMHDWPGRPLSDSLNEFEFVSLQGRDPEVCVRDSHYQTGIPSCTLRNDLLAMPVQRLFSSINYCYPWFVTCLFVPQWV